MDFASNISSEYIREKLPISRFQNRSEIFLSDGEMSSVCFHIQMLCFKAKRKKSFSLNLASLHSAGNLTIEIEVSINMCFR